jgi:hypothetical protein
MTMTKDARMLSYSVAKLLGVAHPNTLSSSEALMELETERLKVVDALQDSIESRGY